MENTILSGKLIRLYARTDSRPLNAANGDIFDSYAERYRSMAKPDDVDEDPCIPAILGLFACADVEDVGALL